MISDGANYSSIVESRPYNLSPIWGENFGTSVGQNSPPGDGVGQPFKQFFADNNVLSLTIAKRSVASRTLRRYIDS